MAPAVINALGRDTVPIVPVMLENSRAWEFRALEVASASFIYRAAHRQHVNPSSCPVRDAQPTLGRCLLIALALT
jgi:hypothetical protein